MIKTLLNLSKIKFSRLAFVGLGFFSLLTPTIAFAEDRGLNIADLTIIKVKVELAKLWIGQFKPYFDSHIGQIDVGFLSNTYLRDGYVALSFTFLSLLLVIEVALILIQKSEFKTFLPRFISSLVASVTYVGIITMTLTIANAIMAFMMGNNGSFIEFSQKSMDVLNLKQDEVSTIFNTIWSVVPGRDISNITGNQTKFVVDLLLGIFSIMPFIIGVGQFVTDLIINVLFILSPLVAITHIHGSKLPITKNFWNIFFDLVISKIAFTFAYTFLVSDITNKINTATGGLNIGLACYIIGCFIAMMAITLAVREVFSLTSNYVMREQIKTSNAAPTRIIQSTTNVVSGGIQTIQSLRRGI